MASERNPFLQQFEGLAQKYESGIYTPKEVIPIDQVEVPPLGDPKLEMIEVHSHTSVLYGHAQTGYSKEVYKIFIGVALDALKTTAVQIAKKLYPLLNKPKQ